MDRAEFYREARDDLPGPLSGVVVLDVTKVWSGPLATAILADLGAEVIRTEHPAGRDGVVPPLLPGTGQSWFRETVNRNKHSVAVDLRTERGRADFLRLVEHADVVVENYRPGTLDAWGVGYAGCRRARPGLVFVSISGYGQYGPRSGLAGYDPVVQAYGGWMALNGGVRAPTFLADDLAGLYGAIGALAALRHRAVTGEGQHVDVAMLDTLLAGSSGLLSLAAGGAPVYGRGNETDFVVPSNAYACKDGSIYLAVALDKQWRALAAVMGRDDLARAPGFGTAAERLANRGAVNDSVAAWCAGQPAASAGAALAAAGIPAAEVRDLAEVAADEHVAEREMLQRVRLHDGSVADLTGPPVKFSRTPVRVRSGAPRPEADIDAIVARLAVIHGSCQKQEPR